MKQREAKHWETYEIQNLDGSWTTVAELLASREQALVEEMLKDITEYIPATQYGSASGSIAKTSFIKYLEEKLSHIRKEKENE